MTKLIILFFLLFAALNGLCNADVFYNITLDTTPLIGNSNGPFAIGFQLTSGDTTSGVVNTATLSQFQFGTGGGGRTAVHFRIAVMRPAISPQQLP